jgi:uncharacterized coiled-coil protein SlyX
MQSTTPPKQKMKPKKMTTPSIRNSINRSPLRRGLPRKQQLPRTQTTWIIRGFLLIPLALALAYFALAPLARAVIPAPDGGYPGNNTAEGDDALFSLTTGTDNTAVGFNALYNNTGDFNTANGSQALLSNTTGTQNTANGFQALFSNTTANQNTAYGCAALATTTTGHNNTATGESALESNTTGSSNTANGSDALFSNTTGRNNIALGDSAGFALTTGRNNIDIGNVGVAAESAKIRIGNKAHKNAYIAGSSGVTVAGGVGVIIDADGHLGTVVSSERFKDKIQPMDKASEAILALQPVTFRYKQELDPDGIPQFGLVAEQVAKVNPDLVARDDQGKPYTVRYEAVNAMLLNEFLKEHREVQEQKVTITQLKSSAAKQEAMIAQQQKQIEALTAGLQKVSAQVEMSKPAPQIVDNNR